MGNFSGNIIQNGTWLTTTDGTVATPGISFFSGRTTGFSRLSSNVDVSLQGVKTASLFANGLYVLGNLSATHYVLGNGAGLHAPIMTISNIQVANASTYEVLDDSAVDTSNGGCIILNGSNFGPGTTISIGSDLVTSVTFVSTSVLRAQIPAKSTGSYTVTATRLDGKTATAPVSVTYSPFPAWSTSSTLANVTKTVAFTRTVAATEATGANVTYAVSSGSSLPANVSLASNGVLSGNIVSDPGNSTTYSFTLDAIDTQYQSSARTFLLYAMSVVSIVNGLVGWYDGASWTGTQWTDKSGQGNHAVTIRGTIGTTTLNGMTVLTGGTTAGLKFPIAILPPTYTFFHVAKYNGASKKRIFDGAGTNWMSGFILGWSGVAYHNNWLTPTGDVHGDTWVLSTDQNSLYRSNFVQRSTASGGTPSYEQLTINYGNHQVVESDQLSDWAVAEVIVYNQTLSTPEIQNVEAYLANKYGLA